MLYFFYKITSFSTIPGPESWKKTATNDWNVNKQANKLEFGVCRSSKNNDFYRMR